MEGQRFRLSRRAALAWAATTCLPRNAEAFGQAGAFHARVLTVGSLPENRERSSGPDRWAWQLIRRTSAPARMTVERVAADSVDLLEEPFAVWFGSQEVPALSAAEVRGLRRFLTLGGVLFVDDSDPASGVFGRGVRRELQRVLPESPIVRVPARHVLYKSYYLLDGPVGRAEGPEFLDAITDGKSLRVVLSAHDVMGALARHPDGKYRFDMPRARRELATRLAVNLAMYVLCLDYKDDQVHAQELMRRRGRRHP